MPGGILYVLAKAPAAGFVKTRLVPPLSPQQACELAATFAADVLAKAAGIDAGIDARLAIDDCEGGEGSTLLRELAMRSGLGIEEQGSGDLGQRMKRLMERGLARGLPTVLIGADSPDLPPQRIADAFTMLEQADVVMVPAGDGGYVLIGAARRATGLFEIDAQWGSERVFAATGEAAARHGLRVRVLEGWDDVDDAAALGRLASRLQGGGGAAAPATAGLLARWRREGVRF